MNNNIKNLNNFTIIKPLFKIIYIPFLLSIILQFAIPFLSVYSIDLLNFLINQIDNTHTYDNNSFVITLLFNNFKIDELLLTSTILFIIFNLIIFCLAFIVSWSTSISIAIMMKKLTPEIIYSIATNQKQSQTLSKEAIVIQRWNLIKNIGDFFHNVIANFIGSIFYIVILIIWIFYENLIAGVLLIILITLWLSYFILIGPKVLNLSKNVAFLEEKVTEIVSDSVKLSDILFLPKSLLLYLEKAKLKITTYSNFINLQGLWGSLLYAGLSMITNIGSILIVIILYQYNYHNFNELFIIYLLLSKVQSPLTTLSSIIPKLQDNRIDFFRFKSAYNIIFHNNEPFYKQKEIEEEVNDIYFYNIKFILNSNSYTFKNLHCHKGNINCISANSGSGKTTILKIISGRLLSETIIEINNNQKVSNSIIYKNTIFIPNEIHLADLSLKENFQLFSSNFKINNKNCNYIYNKLINKYQNKSIYLSTGEKKVLTIISALSSDVQIIIIDEPLSSLDKTLKQLVLELFNEFAKYKLIIISSHEIFNNFHVIKLDDLK